MRDSERPSERFAYKEFISDEAKQYLADVAAKKKDAAAKQVEQKPAAISSAS
jgi:pyruvate ferredoxin oxidoreductase beta subunit